VRTVRRALGLAALSALVVAVVPSATAQTRTVTSVIGSANGLFADLEVVTDVVDPLTFGPAPTVTLPPEGGSVSEEILGVDEVVPGALALRAELVRASAEGALGPAGFATAESTVADVELLEQDSVSVGGILEAEAVTATCAADLEGVSGSTTLVAASVLGTALAAEPEPNTQLVITLPGTLAEVGVTLNRQVQNPDGSLSVTALVLEVDLGEGFITGTLEIGPATCGVVEGEVPPPPAPAPAPVTAQVRFTG
jgi:hypothetical protein